MNIAVSQGDEEGKSFVSYINFLKDKGFVPPNSDEWVDYIRKQGNEATHQIVPKDFTDSKNLIDFVEMILVFLYDFPNRFKINK